jgi:hypothetical protein
MQPITDDLRPLDDQAFGARAEAHRREPLALHVHRYRLGLRAVLGAGVGRR